MFSFVEGDMKTHQKVNSHYHIDPSSSVTQVKEIVTEICTEDTTISAFLLIGDIPVPYSGAMSMDGHPDHFGAWPSDGFYIIPEGDWTDLYVNTTQATRPQNHNVPGDGKFDQTYIPGDADYIPGRIDFSNLPVYTLPEHVLYSNYFIKNHKYRQGELEVYQKGFIQILSDKIHSLDCSGLHDGTYIIRLVTEKRTYYKKRIKQKG